MPWSNRLRPEAYYSDTGVQARLAEYCGATTGSEPTARFVVGFNPQAAPYPTWLAQRRLPTKALSSLWASGWDMSRSLWDAQSLIVAVDLDYQNLDYPGEPFTHPSDVFFKLENSFTAAQRVLAHLELPAMPVSTGRGYHFVGRVPLDSPVLARLADLHPVPAWFATHTQRKGPDVAAMPEAQARAAAGLGLLLEHLAHLVVAEAGRTNLIPLVFNGTTVGSGEVGRECVSIDFSHAGDPLDIRHIRMAFSTYQWHRIRPDIFGAAVSALPPLAAVPRVTSSLEAFLLAGRDLESVRQIAAGCHAALPDVSAGVDALISSYVASPLAQLHREFSTERALLDGVPRRLPEDMPPCIALCLEQPNDLLLKPEHLQNLVRLLLARQWSGAEIALLVQRKYEEDHRWGRHWEEVDPRTRADFDVRVFSSLALTGLDRAIDFNCASSQDKGICPHTACTHDLRFDRDQLMTRVAQRNTAGDR